MDQLKKFFSKISDDDVFTQAAALAYFTALAMAPLIILLVSFLSLLKFSLQEHLLVQANGLIGPEASKVLEAIIDSANQRPDLSVGAGWVGAAVLVFSASVIFAQLQSALNIIFRAPKVETPDENAVTFILGFIRKRLLSMGILLTFIFMSIVSLFVSAGMAYVMDGYDFLGIKILIQAGNLLVYALLFFMIYKWIPDRRVRSQHSFGAGLMTAALFVGGKSLIGSYIGQTAMGSAYGAAGSLIVLLAWIYYSALIFFLGAEAASVFLIKKEKTA